MSKVNKEVSPLGMLSSHNFTTTNQNVKQGNLVGVGLQVNAITSFTHGLNNPGGKSGYGGSRRSQKYIRASSGARTGTNSQERADCLQ